MLGGSIIKLRLIIGFLLIILITGFYGCGNQFLLVSGQNKFISNGISYEVLPYSPQTHQEYSYDSFFTDLDYNTAFVIKISNLSALPYKTGIANSFVLQDSNSNQQNNLKNPYIYWQESQNNNYSPDYSFSNYKDLNMEANLLMDDIATQNLEYYKTQLYDLKKKIYLLEKNQLLAEDIRKREKSLKNIFEIYGFKDQLLYPQGSSSGLIVFPPLRKELTNNLKLFFIIPPNQMISVSFTLSN